MHFNSRNDAMSSPGTDALRKYSRRRYSGDYDVSDCKYKACSRFFVLCCVVLCYVVCCVVLCCDVLCCVVLHCLVLSCLVLSCLVLSCLVNILQINIVILAFCIQYTHKFILGTTYLDRNLLIQF